MPSTRSLLCGSSVALLLLTACPAEPSLPAPDEAPLRRLTAAQYNNTTRDLLAGLEVPHIAFPPELHIGGFDNNTTVNTVSPALVEAYQGAALSVSEALLDQLDPALPCAVSDEVEPPCAEEWLLDFAHRAYRRPLTEAEQEETRTLYRTWMAQSDWQLGLQSSVQLLLQSPDFLYVPEYGGPATDAQGGVPLGSWELATRLSYFLWNTMPDAELFALAEAGALATREEVTAQAWRMLADPKARDGLAHFTRQWLDLELIGNTQVDLNTYFDDEDEQNPADYLHQVLQPAMLLEPELFVLNEVFAGSGTLAGLLTSRQTFATPQLADLYGQELDTSGTPVLAEVRASELGYAFEQELYPLELDATERAGLMTLSGVLHSRSKPVYPSPVLRGVFVLERILCTPPGAPPDDVPPLESAADEVQPETNRDRYAQHSLNPACAACHDSIDGIGFTFENYDSLGRFRLTDNGHPVDSSGQIIGSDVDGQILDAVQLAETLAQSQTVHDCMTELLFRSAFGRGHSRQDLAQLGLLQEGFWGAGGDIPELFVNIAASYAFRHRQETP